MSKKDEAKVAETEALFDVLSTRGPLGASKAELSQELVDRELATERVAPYRVGYAMHRLRLQMGIDLPIFDKVKKVYRFAIDAVDAEIWLRHLGLLVVRRIENLIRYLDIFIVRFPREEERKAFEAARGALTAAAYNVTHGLRLVEDRSTTSTKPTKKTKTPSA